MGPFTAQDLVLVVYFVLFATTIYRGVTRPAHVPTHVLIVGTALFTPFVGFHWARLADVPAEAWAFCLAFVGMQMVHTAFHVLRPHENHARGPEILFQPIVCIWVAVLRYQLDPTLWYRGHLGVFFFCLGTLYLSLAVLMLVYMGEMTSSPGDDIDLLRRPWRTRDNAAFLVAAASALMVTLFVTFQQPLWLLAAAVAFLAVRTALPPLSPAVQKIAEHDQTRGFRTDGTCGGPQCDKGTRLRRVRRRRRHLPRPVSSYLRRQEKGCGSSS